jgi:cysteinyl-tRNA synthetase
MAALSEKAAAVFGRWCRPCDQSPPKLHIYNSLTRSKVPFYPIDPSGQRVTMYVCGPTVYDAAHLGHARTYLQFDVIRRILRDVLGYDVVYVMNVTDVDDKIIVRSQERGITPEALAREWERKFLEDMTSLGVERPSAMPRVTEYVPEIVSFVETCIQNGFAYEDQGSVYFDTRAFESKGHDYGKLCPENIGNQGLMAEGEGKLASTTFTKRDDRDFALWKASKPGEPTWPSPWGAGRPGWHIECSAMIEHTIGHGGPIDIHGGGVDLKFPHHDNELAQQEAFCNCRQTVNYFAHTGHLHIRGLKMSKSLKNFITIRQALEGVDGLEGVRPSTMRIMFCLVQYNAPCDYSDNMWGAASSLRCRGDGVFMRESMRLVNLTRSRRWRLRETAPPRRRRCGRMTVYASRTRTDATRRAGSRTLDRWRRSSASSS